MEKIINTDIILHIVTINGIIIQDGKCVVDIDTKEYGRKKMVFEDVWDCRYTIENGGIDRNSKIKCEYDVPSSIYEVIDSVYLEYFEKQVSGTRPINELKDYILFDDVETIFEVLSNNKPYLE